MTESDIKEARKSMSEAEFKQEYEADFNTYEGQIWKFNFEECTADLSNLDTSRMDVFAGLDVGFKDPTAMCVIAYDWDAEKYYLLAEYLNSERTTEQHAEEIQKLIDLYDIDYIYIDSAAQQTRFDFAQNYGISTINAKKSVLDGISHVASLMDNDKIIIDQMQKECLVCVDAYQWDPNPNLIKEKPRHNMASHMADALRYALYSFQSSATSF
jgi:phage terminase large subunit